MRILPITFVLVLFIPLFVNGQDKKDDIKTKLIKSDSILILSHENLWIDTIPGKTGFHRQVVIEDISNKSITREQIKLDNISKEFLLKLFEGMIVDSLFQSHSCYDPHHSILFFEKGKCSYIDICFGCKVFGITEDLVVDDNFLTSDRDWKALALFFIDRKVDFKIEKK